jgi:Calpain family cysteine protease
MKTQEIAPKARAQEPPTAEGKTMTPPAFSLEATNKDGSGGDKPKEKDYNKEPKKGLFAKTERIDGPLAVKGEGDAHEFAANDVGQGDLGDCFFMAPMISLAKNRPDDLKKLLKQNEDGSFEVKLALKNEKGDVEWKDIHVEPIFVKGKNEDTKFATLGDGGELWPLIMEKAYAQLKGSYRKISGGYDNDAFTALTGRKFEKITVSKSDDATSWMDRFSDCRRKHLLMTVSTHDKFKDLLDNEGYVPPGIQANHSYAFINFDRKKNTVTIENPWSTEGETTLEFEDFKRVIAEATMEVEFQ